MVRARTRWPDRWQLAALIAVGAVIGLLGVAVRASNATSYLSNDASACLNCHIMGNAYATWMRGSHGRKTVCNDCHVPHVNLVGKMAFKAMDGARHATVFTLRREPQVLHLNDLATRVVQNNCLRCHGQELAMVRLAGSTERVCWDCHAVHGNVQSLSASDFARRPSLPRAGLFPRSAERKENSR